MGRWCRVIRQAGRVAWLKWRHRNGCYRWQHDGRCIDCLEHTGEPAAEWLVLEVRSYQSAGFTEQEAVALTAKRLGTSEGRVYDVLLEHEIRLARVRGGAR